MGSFMVWLKYTPSTPDGEPAPVVLGPGPSRPRREQRMNGVLTAVCGLLTTTPLAWCLPVNGTGAMASVWLAHASNSTPKLGDHTEPGEFPPPSQAAETLFSLPKSLGEVQAPTRPGLAPQGTPSHLAPLIVSEVRQVHDSRSQDGP